MVRLFALVTLTVLVTSAPPLAGALAQTVEVAHADTLAGQAVNVQEAASQGGTPPEVPAQVPTAPTTPATTGATPGGNGGATGPAALTAALAAIENLPKYKDADWGYSVLDQKTGDVIAAQNADKMFDPGSTMKTYSVSTALRFYGDSYQFKTPVYRAGTVSGDALNGNLILVGSGDLSFGLREQPDGTLYYENLPDIDQSYAYVGLPGAVEPPGNPLTALDELASQVRASGISHVNGDVVIDDRLFTPYNGFPDGLISPIWVNENLISILVSPGSAAGQPTSISWRPMVQSYTVDNQATTVAATDTTSLEVKEPTPRHLVVTGTIAVGPNPPWWCRRSRTPRHSRGRPSSRRCSERV
jgi:D-alanyl-D-alanine carboxypeptidase/D-alanyl-D-alanine-endopeptidase (penicillin-binding protein 4)